MVQSTLFDGKVCHGCGNWWLLDSYYLKATSRDGHFHYCKTCVLKQHQAWKCENRDVLLRQGREYRQGHADDRQKYAKGYRELTRNERATYKKRWKAEHHKLYTAHNRRASHTRRARLRQSSGDYTTLQWEELCCEYGYKCLACGEIKPLTVDHIVPISKGGTNDIGNIQPLCMECNQRKWTRITDYRNAENTLREAGC